MRKRPDHRLDVEGLRAVAILAVVLYHAHVWITRGGFVGVDIFFVVSGFLITGLLWRELEQHNRLSFASFYGRRARRLLPASVLVVIVTIVSSARWLPPLQVHDVVKDALSSSLYVANVRFAVQSTNYLTSAAPPSPFQQFWSLGVEEQFYLVWPALLVAVSLLWRRTGRHSKARALSPRLTASLAVGLVTTGSLALSLWLTHHNQPWAFFSFPSRAWELGAGGLLALATPWLRRLPAALAAALGWLGVGLVLWSVTQLSDSTSFPGTAALVPVCGTVAVIAAGSVGALWGPVVLLGQRAFRVVGRLSYSWYLWHWPVLVITPAIVGHSLGVWANLGLVGLSGLMAAATVVTVEAPARFSPWLSGAVRRSLSVGGGLTAAAVVSCGLVAVTLPVVQGQIAAPMAAQLPLVALPSSAPAAAYTAAAKPVVTAVAGSLMSNAVPSNLAPPLAGAHHDEAAPFVDGCLDSFTDAVVRSCAYGDTSSSTTVVLWGDSHAAQWFPAFDDLAKSRGWRLVVLTKATCPPSQIDVFSPELGRNYRECDDWRARVLARIRKERPALVVLGVARHYNTLYHFTVYSPAWAHGLASMVSTIRRTGTAVAVMGSIPKPAVDIPNCLSAHLKMATECTQPLSDTYSTQGVESERAAVAAVGGSYIDTHSWFCSATTCAVIVDNLLVYRDDNHLTTTYAAWLAPVVGAALDEGPLRGQSA